MNCADHEVAEEFDCSQIKALSCVSKNATPDAVAELIVAKDFPESADVIAVPEIIDDDVPHDSEVVIIDDYGEGALQVFLGGNH